VDVRRRAASLALLLLAFAPGGLLAARRDAADGAAGLVLGVAWLGGVLGGQRTEGPEPPVRWRVVYRRPGS
jgi:hypothetical protein